MTCWTEKGLKLQDVFINKDLAPEMLQLLNIVDYNGAWNWNMLQLHLPTPIIENFCAIAPPVRDSPHKDICIWSGTDTVEFSIANFFDNYPQMIRQARTVN